MGNHAQLQTMITAPDEEAKSWYEEYEDVYDTENCLIDKKIHADHRNRIKIARADMLLADLKLPEIVDQKCLFLDRKVIDPLSEEL